MRRLRGDWVRGAQVTIWHINAGEPRALDDNEESKSAGQVTSLYSDDRYRSSDHEPLIVGLELSAALPYLGYLPLAVYQ